MGNVTDDDDLNDRMNVLPAVGCRYHLHSPADEVEQSAPLDRTIYRYVAREELNGTIGRTCTGLGPQRRA